MQLFLQLETNICRVVDPWGGSYHVEKLTHEIAHKAWELIEEVENKYKDFFGDIKIKQLSIFLSPLNVHVNCFPVNGVLKYFNYIKGKYLVAFNHKASEMNERSELGVETPEGKKIIFKQIAGFVARRIVCNIKLNEEVKAGQKFGMIKFGSRVDLLFDTNTDVKVKIGDKVVAGISILANLK